MQSARIVLVKGDLNGIVRARLLSGAVMRNIRQNLFFAFVYNAAGVPIAAGALYPLTGWLLKSDHRFGGDGVVVGIGDGNSLRLRRAELSPGAAT